MDNTEANQHTDICDQVQGHLLSNIFSQVIKIMYQYDILLAVSAVTFPIEVVRHTTVSNKHTGWGIRNLDIFVLMEAHHNDVIS